ncbi:hypothetical protein [Lichenicoccus sp.]|uniref:hypothetical protein n=1 Tax=Lichenicoccus sp. TaxID=2781899 RepID=UPI003D0BDF90
MSDPGDTDRPPSGPIATPSATEDVPATPGWVEQGVDEILATLPQRPALRALRNSYLDCLAAAGRTRDLDETHDRCRRRLLTALLEEEHLSRATVDALERKLEALEADISDNL